MHRPGLQARQAKLVQPFADCALMHRHRPAARHLRLQINAAPTHHLVRLRVRAADDQFAQFGLLRSGQIRLPARAGARLQAGNALSIVAMHPVGQRLAIHATQGRPSARGRPSRTNAIAKMRRTCAPSMQREDNPRSAAAVCSTRVTLTPVPMKPPQCESAHHDIESQFRAIGNPLASRGQCGLV